MDLKQLRHFAWIAELGSFSRAARHLRVAQPALSHHIRQLEDDLQVSLFERTARGVQLTQSGVKLLEQARLVLRQVDRAREAVLETNGSPRGRVSIGLSSSVSFVLTMPLIDAVREQHPAISLHVVEAMSGFLLEWVQQGRLDMAIVFDCKSSPELTSELLVREDLYLVGAYAKPPFPRRTVRFSQLGNYPLVLPGLPHGLRLLVDSYAAERHIALNVALELDAAHHIRTLVQEGFAYAIVARTVVADELVNDRVSAFRIVDPTITRDVMLVRDNSRSWPRACESVWQIVIDLANSLATRRAWPAKVPRRHRSRP